MDDSGDYYWLRGTGGKWTRVNREEFIRAERSAGFYSTAGSDVATAGFSGPSIEGAITDNDKPPLC